MSGFILYIHIHTENITMINGMRRQLTHSSDPLTIIRNKSKSLRGSDKFAGPKKKKINKICPNVQRQKVRKNQRGLNQ